MEQGIPPHRKAVFNDILENCCEQKSSLP